MANARQTVHQQATQGFTGLASPITVPPIVSENSWQIPSYAILHGAPNDATYLQLFPFSLAGRAATWLDSQPTGTFTTWAGLRQAFLNKYFPPAKASRLRDQIHFFRMEPDEPYYLAWERFQNLCARCSQHGLSDWALCEKFYNGLSQESRDRFDTNAGGHMMGILTVAECLERFEAFSQSQSQSRSDQRYQSGNSNTTTSAPARGVNHVTMDPSLAVVLENMSRELKEIKAKVDECEYCRGGHDTSACPLLVGEEQVDFVGGGQGRGQPSGFGNNNFGSGWHNNNNNFASTNNFRSNGPPGFQIAQNPTRGLGSLFGGGSNGQVKDGGSSSQVQTGQGSSYDLRGSLERMESMMSQLIVRDQTTHKKLSEHDLMLKNHQAAFQDLQRVVGDMSKKLEERLPGQFAGNTQPNPNAHVKTITTRSGKTVGDPSVEERVVDEDGDIVDEKIEMEAPGKVQSRLRPASTAQPGESQGEKRVEKPPVDVRPSPLVNHAYVPFPSRLKNQKYSREYGQFLDIFKQLKINLPFIEALQSMPKYAKFLKDLLRNKEKLGELSNVPLHGGCSAVVSNQLPEKLTDPGVFTIPCLFGSNTNTRALADLGASINLMPFSLYEKLDLGELSPTRMTLSLADRSVKHPRGIIENLLVKVDKFVFPADFVILDMEADENVPLILGRPFLNTAKALIDVFLGTITLRAGEESVVFKVMNSKGSSDRVQAVSLVGECEKDERDEEKVVSDPSLEKVIGLKCEDPPDRRVEELEERMVHLESKIETLSKA
ncbi:uncharacterized protein LOC110937011 [Helianthus annuus]|uniref:uncharacterized protein LOC110937011 n=1 Tax=Helianthus annuus TaxID=4232 RepID=UPI000B8FBDC4|nr:uncharacterized protein LOC110937011 [Helianthus annuus]